MDGWVAVWVGGGIHEHKSEEKPLKMYIKLFLQLTKENGWVGGWMDGWEVCVHSDKSDQQQQGHKSQEELLKIYLRFNKGGYVGGDGHNSREKLLKMYIKIFLHFNKGGWMCGRLGGWRVGVHTQKSKEDQALKV